MVWALIKIDSDKLVVRTPYHPTLNKIFEEMKGKYDYDMGWLLPLEVQDKLENKLLGMNISVKYKTELPEMKKQPKIAYIQQLDENFEIFTSFDRAMYQTVNCLNSFIMFSR